MVLVRIRRRPLVDEQVPRHASHRIEDPLILDPAADELLLDHPRSFEGVLVVRAAIEPPRRLSRTTEFLLLEVDHPGPDGAEITPSSSSTPSSGVGY
ncbi:MAG: hypothetical protein ACTHJI_04610 [Leifsonia sp.]